jgi:hypothetical protein
MFPNMRLMIAAIAASIVMLSCGFGVFAAFRINHDPFGRLPNAAPLQLGAEAMTSSVVTLAAGPNFGARVARNETRSAGAASPAPDRAGEIDATNAIAVPAPAPAADVDEPAPAMPTVAIAQQPIAPLPDADPATGAPADSPTGTTSAGGGGGDAKPDAVAAATEAPAGAAPDGAAAATEAPAGQTAPVKQAAVEPTAEPQAADEIQMPDKEPQSESTDKTENAGAAHAAKARRIAPRKIVANKIAANKIGAKKTAGNKTVGKQHVAAATSPHRARGFRVRTVVQASPETSGLEQSGLQTAPATPVRLTRLHRTARAGGVGGPFVRPPVH